MPESLITLIAVLMTFVAAAWIYFRIFQRAGLLFVIAGVVLVLSLVIIFPVFGLVVAVGIIAAAIFFEVRTAARKTAYPGVDIVYEGGGVRRGLTAAEVSVLFKQSPQEGFLLALVAIMQKNLGVIDFSDGAAGKVQLVGWIRTDKRGLDPAERTKYRTDNAFARSIILLPYEDVLLELFEQNQGKKIHELDVGLWYMFLEKKLSQKVAGYDLSDTLAFYQAFIAHRTEKVWNTDKAYLLNLPWLILAFLQEESGIENIQEILASIKPEWLPAEISLVDFVTDFVTE